MENLLEVSRLLNKKKVKKIEIFDEYNLKNKKSKFNELYEALLIEKFKSDNEASQELYGCQAIDDRYRQLKSRFRKRLHNTLFFLDVNTPSTSTYERARYNSDKDWATVNILEQNSAKLSAEKVAKTVLKTAQKFNFLDLIIASSRYLKIQALKNGDYNSIDTLNDIEVENKALLILENEAEDLFLKVYSTFRHPKLNNSNKKVIIQESLDKLFLLSEKDQSLRLKDYSYKAYFYFLELERDYHSIKELVNNAIQIQKTKSNFFNSNEKASWYYKQLYASLLLNDENIITLAQNGLKNISYQAQDWLNYMSLYFLGSMNSENYLLSVNIMNDILQSHQFKKASTKQRILWNSVYNPFLNFILLKNKSNNPLLRVQKTKQFKLLNYLQLPIVDLPKKTINLKFSTLTAKVILCIATNTPIEGLLSDIHKLSIKKMKTDDFFRTQLFLKCIYNIHYNKKDKILYSQSTINKLKSKPLYFSSKRSPIEIIRYELILESLYL